MTLIGEQNVFNTDIENLWSILKWKEYMGKKDFWDALVTASKDISSDKLKKNNIFIFNGQVFFSHISNNGGYLKY